MAKKPVEYEDRRQIYDELFDLRKDDLPDLKNFGMKQVAWVTFESGLLAVEYLAEWDGRWPGVYAFVADKRVVRVGSSAAKVRRRLADYPRDINTRLGDLDAPHTRATPPWEARLWALIYGGLTKESGQVWARQSRPIMTPIGSVSGKFSCKAEESIVAAALSSPGLRQPVLNCSSRIA